MMRQQSQSHSLLDANHVGPPRRLRVGIQHDPQRGGQEAPRLQQPVEPRQFEVVFCLFFGDSRPIAAFHGPLRGIRNRPGRILSVAVNQQSLGIDAVTSAQGSASPSVFFSA